MTPLTLNSFALVAIALSACTTTPPHQNAPTQRPAENTPQRTPPSRQSVTPQLRDLQSNDFSSFGSSRAITSNIVDDFEELDEGAILQLENGQIWKQTSYDYEYNYGFRPDVLIYKDGSQYRAKIEGFRRTPTVERLR